METSHQHSTTSTPARGLAGTTSAQERSLEGLGNNDLALHDAEVKMRVLTYASPATRDGLQSPHGNATPTQYNIDPSSWPGRNNSAQVRSLEGHLCTRRGLHSTKVRRMTPRSLRGRSPLRALLPASLGPDTPPRHLKYSSSALGRDNFCTGAEPRQRSPRECENLCASENGARAVA
jgi:hypothetical protein